VLQRFLLQKRAEKISQRKENSGFLWTSIRRIRAPEGRVSGPFVLPGPSKKKLYPKGEKTVVFQGGGGEGGKKGIGS